MQVIILLEQVNEELRKRANALMHTENEARRLGNEALAYSSRFWRNKIIDIYLKINQLINDIDNTMFKYEVEACEVADSIYRTLSYINSNSKEKYITEPLKRPLLIAYKIVKSICNN